MTNYKGIGAFYLPCFIPVDEWPEVYVGHEGACGWCRYAPARGCRREMRGVKDAPGFIRGFCSLCGGPVDEGDAYCPRCGAKVVEE